MASSNIDELYLDEANLIELINLSDDETILISDEYYARQISFQEALFSSSSTPKTEKKELGESSNSNKFILCGICMESKEISEIFTGLSKCNHTFCSECVRIYLMSKIQESIAFVKCPYPNCNNSIEPENCDKILPKEVFCRWEDAVCESLIPESQKFYCPYKDCSALMVDDGVEEVTMSECPCCRKLFCAQCRVKWHVEVTCEEFQELGDDERETGDLMVMKLARDNKWRRCSSCNYFVEKNEGCLHMTCRCRHEFCYQCGEKWNSNDHICS